MEDCYDVVLNYRDRSDEAFFAIFDGHSGPQASKFAAKNVSSTIAAQEKLDSDTSASMKNAFLAVDRAFLTIVSEKLDRTKRLMTDGTTATTVYIKGKTLYCCNLGDSECVMSNDGAPVVCSKIHTPNLPKEKARIEQTGVLVRLGRIAGQLAVPRGIGDAAYKDLETKGPSASTAKPSIKTFAIDDSIEFVVLACDGLWDVLTPEQVVKFISRRQRDAIPLKEIADELVKHAIDKGSMDNVSVIIVAFEHKDDYGEEDDLGPQPDMLNDQLPVNNSFRS